MTWEATPTGKRGRQPDYSNAAIQTCLTMKVWFGMALRQTTGFVESCLWLIAWTGRRLASAAWSRCHKTLRVNNPYRGSGCPMHLLIDSTADHSLSRLAYQAQQNRPGFRNGDLLS